MTLHGVLLFVPLPSSQTLEETAETDTEAEEDAPLDLLAVSEILPPETPQPQEPQAPQPEPSSPPPSNLAPPIPDPERIPENLPESPPEDIQDGADFPEETSTESSREVDSGFDAVRLESLLGRTGLINAEFDKTDGFPLLGWGLGRNQNYVGDWPSERHSCFFSRIDPDTYDLAPGAELLKFFTRNYAFVIEEDLPATFSGQDLIEVSGGYCGGQLFEVRDEGVTQLFVSAVGVGPGDPPGSLILVFWTSDPR